MHIITFSQIRFLCLLLIESGFLRPHAIPNGIELERLRNIAAVKSQLSTLLLVWLFSGQLTFSLPSFHLKTQEIACCPWENVTFPHNSAFVANQLLVTSKAFKDNENFNYFIALISQCCVNAELIAQFVT